MDFRILSNNWLRNVFVLCLSIFCTSVNAITDDEINRVPLMQKFIQQMVSQFRFEEKEVLQWLHQTQTQPEIIKTISKPLESKSWTVYRHAFITNARVNAGASFWEHQHETLMRAQEQFGIPARITLAILGVETNYGKKQGNYRIPDALATLAFYYPSRSEFFFDELKTYMVLARELRMYPFTVKGSYAGAMGQPQFMPTSYMDYGIDYDGDGRVDLIHSTKDSIGSIANYLKMHGWRREQPIVARISFKKNNHTNRFVHSYHGKTLTVARWRALGAQVDPELSGKLHGRLMAFPIHGHKEYWLAFNNFDVIMTYNKSPLYAMAVYQLAHEVKQERYARLELAQHHALV